MSAKEKILEAADMLFGEVGFDAASTREIAERSGVNKALIHYHFDTKDQLLRSVLDRYYEKLTETVTQSLSGDQSVRERMQRLIETYIDFLDANRNFSRIVQREAAGGKHMETILGHMEPLIAIGRTLINQAYPQTKKGAMAAEQIMVSFYGMILGYFAYGNLLEKLLKSDPFSKKNLALRKAHIKQMADIVFTSIEDRDE